MRIETDAVVRFGREGASSESSVRKDLDVSIVDHPLSNASFGSIGSCVALTLSHGGESFPPVTVELEPPVEKLELLDPESIRMFAISGAEGRSELVEASGFDEANGRIFMTVTRPGTYGAFGLPRHPGVLETIRLLYRYRTELLQETLTGRQDLQPRICQFILCGPGVPEGLCEQCLGLQIPMGGLPEFRLLPEHPEFRPFTAVCTPGVKLLPHHQPPRTDHPVLAWGYNGYGQLGDGSTRNSSREISTLATALAVACGDFHSLGLKADGSVIAWGEGQWGQLGDGNTVARHAPVPVQGLSGVVAVFGGGNHSLALDRNGEAWSWGHNLFGQLGLGNAPGFSTTPKKVPNFGWGKVIALAAGTSHSLAITDDGSVWAWGRNYAGQLGDGYTISRTSPVRVILIGATPAIAVAAGDAHSLALLRDGTVVAWGRNQSGQLGDGTKGSDRHVPAVVAGLAGVAGIEAGTSHCLALKSDGSVWSWGAGGAGQLGTGTTQDAVIPALILGLPSGIEAIAAGGDDSLALAPGAVVWGWGSNKYGEVGDGTQGGIRSKPALVKDPPAAELALAAGLHHCLAIMS